MSDKFRLYWHTLRHLRMSQIFWRLRITIKRRCRLYRVPGTPSPAPPLQRNHLRNLNAFLHHADKHGIGVRADMELLRDQSFTFINRPAPPTGDIPWHDKTLPKLWRYQLHGFCHGRDFAVRAVSEEHLGDRDRALNWMRSWIASNPAGKNLGWDAWPISERLIQWTLLMAAFQLHEEDISISFARQLQWLKHWVEYDLRGNHLLKNAVALTLGALILNDPPLLEKGLAMLKGQLREQVLPDGGHIERSPMYHAHALWDGLVLYTALEEQPGWLEDALVRMTRFLEQVCHPDGEIPLFGDSAVGQAPPAAALIKLARQVLPKTYAPTETVPAGHSLPDSGFYIMGTHTAGHSMVIKTAPPSPPYQPGHSHCDMFSYELSVYGQRLVVDSGTHGYAESELRSYCRSTAAHNTARLDDREQSETWRVFRVAQRPAPLPPSFSAHKETALLKAGYRHFSNYDHYRSIAFYQREMYWDISDHITAPAGLHEMESFVHLHPDCVMYQKENGVVLSMGKITAHLELCSEGTIELNAGADKPTLYRYCPEFGIALPSPTIIMTCIGTSLLEIRYRITLR